MKLLHEVTRLRLRVRLLLTRGCKTRERSYVVTVPAPLGRLSVAPTAAAGVPLAALAGNDTHVSPMRMAGHG
jgi:hypothetical protein